MLHEHTHTVAGRGRRNVKGGTVTHTGRGRREAHTILSFLLERGALFFAPASPIPGAPFLLSLGTCLIGGASPRSSEGGGATDGSEPALRGAVTGGGCGMGGGAPTGGTQGGGGGWGNMGGLRGGRGGVGHGLHREGLLLPSYVMR